MDMVEKVARAICETLFGFYDENDDSPLSTLGQSRLAARAAIAAMREPTETMAQRGYGYVAVDGVLRVDLKDAWRAMIDAALTSSEPPK